MKTSEAIELIANLRDVFPSHHFPPSSVKVYAEMIGDLDGSAVGQAVREIMAESRFFPTIAEIRERVARTACNGLPNVEAALAELDAAVRKFSPDDSSTWTWDDDWSHPLIARAVRMVGGVAQLWGSRTPGVDRREFKAATSAWSPSRCAPSSSASRRRHPCGRWTVRHDERQGRDQLSGLLRGHVPGLYAVRVSAAAQYAVHIARGGSRRAVCGRRIPPGASRHRITLEQWRKSASICFACSDALQREERHPRGGTA